MDVFQDFLQSIENEEHKIRMEEILNWVKNNFPDLEPIRKWNQPMFTDHGTYIIGFSISKYHIAVAPEQVTIRRFIKDIEKNEYDHTKEIIRIKWNQPIDYNLLSKMIEFNILDKKGHKTFWRLVL